LIIFLKQTDPSKVLLLKAGQHGKLVRNNWENVEKENTTHTRLYVDYKHSMWYHASWNGPKVPFNKLENKPIYVWDQDAVQRTDGNYDYIPNWEGAHEYGDWDPKSQYWWASNYSGSKHWSPISAAWRKVSWMMPEEGTY
jgi:hypothetical protein